MIRILAISGSLRPDSTNTRLLRAAAMLTPREVEISLYPGLGALPHFIPNMTPEPASVADLRARIRNSDGIVIASPEYAHGIAGVLKNALDWLVAAEEFVGKPVALFNASPRASHAQASLIEVITTMSGRIIPEAAATVQLLGAHLDEAAIVAHPQIANAVRMALENFARAIAWLRESAE